MKKLICVLLAVLMMASLLAACGGGGEASTPDAGASAAAPDEGGDAAGGDTGDAVTVSYWTHIEEPWNISDEKMIAAFEAEYPNIKIEREMFPYDEFEQKTQTSLLSQSGGADIYKLWGGWAVDFAPTGAFDAVPDDFIAELVADCYDPVLGSFEYEGSYYGVPLEFNAEWGGMLVNKPYFDDNGIDYPTTWDEMIQIATDASESDGAVFNMRGLDFATFDTLPYMFLSMILSSGGQYVNDGVFDFDTAEAKDALQKMVDYVNVDKMTSMDGLTGGTELENFDWIYMNEALMAPRGIWTIPVGVNDYEVEYGVDFDYIPTPFYGSEQKWAAETGWGLAVNSGSEHTEEAWLFVEFMMRPENLLQINIDCGMIPPRKSVATDPALLEAMPYAEPIINVLDGAQYVGYINTDVLKESIINAFLDVQMNGTPVDEALVALNSNLL